MEILIPVMIVLFLLGVLFGLITGPVAYKKGRSFGKWFVYGVLTSVIALIHSFIIRPDRDGIAANIGRDVGVVAGGKPNSEGLILEARRPMRAYAGAFLFFPLILPIIGVAIARKSLRLQVFSDRIVLHTGFISKAKREIFITDLRTIDAAQGWNDRIFDIGSIALATAGTGGFEISISNLGHPHEIREVIAEQKRLLMTPPPPESFSHDANYRQASS